MELSSDTAELLRPNQVQEMAEEIETLEKTINSPGHIRAQITDIGAMRKRLLRLRSDRERLTPRAYSAEEKDAAVAEFEALAEKIGAGMPSSEVMRRNPPGAVSQHNAWQNRTKKFIARYKHIALRLMAGGDVPASLRNQGDVANVELLRPLKTSHDVSMHGAQIARKTDIHIGSDPVGTVLFTAEEEAALMDMAPALAGSLAVLDNDARAQIKGLLEAAMSKTADLETVKAEKPELHELTYNEMKKIAAKAGMENVRKATKTDLIVFLRARHLIQ